MRWFGRAVLVALVAGATTLALWIVSSTTLADTFSLNMSMPSSGTVGQPVVVTSTGNDPTDGGALYEEIDAIPTTLTATCPAGYNDASQLAASTPEGAFVAFDERENFDASGNFSNVNAWTPNAAGQFVVCGYTDDGALDTLAVASMLVAVTPPAAPTPTVSKPVNTAKPRVTRSGNALSCSVGRWRNAPRKYSYRWLVAHKVKSGAHGRKLGSAQKLRGHGVQCSVTAANSAGSTTATSASFKVH
jgi:hypothetical protein